MENIEVVKLLEYANLAGFTMWINEDRLIVGNGKQLTPNLKEQITIHKEDIMQLLKSGWVP